MVSYFLNNEPRWDPYRLVQSSTGHDTMCSEVLAFGEAVVPENRRITSEAAQELSTFATRWWVFVVDHTLQHRVALRLRDCWLRRPADSCVGLIVRLLGTASVTSGVAWDSCTRACGFQSLGLRVQASASPLSDECSCQA